jgi:hypothetical protein
MKSVLLTIAAGAFALNFSAAVYAQEAGEEPTVDEPTVDEPVVDDGVEYDPVIAQSGVGTGEVQRDGLGSKGLFSHSDSVSRNDEEPTYKILWKNGKLYKIPQ